jgi:hypothetical protein
MYDGKPKFRLERESRLHGDATLMKDETLDIVKTYKLCQKDETIGSSWSTVEESKLFSTLQYLGQIEMKNIAKQYNMNAGTLDQFDEQSVCTSK